MSFNVAAEAYDRFMGRYSIGLAPQLADFAGVRPDQRVLDVGCGPGALTTELVARAGASNVSAVDPSASFVAAVRQRLSGVEVLQATAERLPFGDRTFDASLAQLVVHFMTDPVTGLREMARVTRPGGAVAACVWDHSGDGPLSLFWRAARELDPAADDESELPGVRPGHLVALFEAAGLREVASEDHWVHVEHPTFEAWWEPFTRGVGPAGSYLASLPPDRQEELRETARRHAPPAPFEVAARAWAVRGRP